MIFLTRLVNKPSGCLRKVLLLMKLTVFLMILAVTQVYAAASYAQKVTLQKNNASLKSIFSDIRNQTGYDFLADAKLINQAKPVSVHIKDAPLEDALNQIFNNTNLTYTIVEKSIVVKTKIPISKKPAASLEIKVNGRVINEKGEPLAGATIRIKGSNMVIGVGGGGGFTVVLPDSSAVLVVSYIGYETKEVVISGADVDLVITLKQKTSKLEDVNIVSTGYYEIPKERATGSFETLSGKQLNMVTSPDILSRMEGNVTGFNFNPQLTPTSSSSPDKTNPLNKITIRGSNSFNPSYVTGGVPLVVVDGVALEDNQAGSSVYQDPVGNLNPNDVESVTILKDAASASIWGSRAANGVIVIVTKKGKYNQHMQASLNSNVSVTEKPNLFYYKRASTADFVDYQKNLYNNGFFDNALSDAQFAAYNFPLENVPGVVEILEQQKNGQITADQANAQLATLGQNDVRRDITKYMLRNSVQQQHSLSISGGSQDIAYRLSGGYDNDINNTITSSANRLTLSSSTTVKVTKNFNLQANIDYAQSNRKDESVSSYFAESGNSGHAGTLFDPYTRLADNNGTPLNVIHNFRPGYVDTLGHGNLLDLHYAPLTDIKQGYDKVRDDNLRINLQGNYRFTDALSAEIIYSYQRETTNSDNVDFANSYIARYVVDEYTTPYNYVDPTSGSPNPYHRTLPLGGIYQPTDLSLSGQTLRGLLTFNKTWNKHTISAIAGGELRNSYGISTHNYYYGYNENTLQYNNQLDFARQDIPTLWYGGMGQIPYTSEFFDNRQRAISEFANVAYTYDNRYTLSASVRRDGSNVFGVATNNSFSPFYSVGGLWNINNEKFYHIEWLPVLHARVTFGYNGNVNYSVAPTAGISYATFLGQNGLQYGFVSGATNNSLRPERSGILNLGLDFGFKNDRISGSAEYYVKHDNALLENSPVDMSTGFSSVNHNAANMTISGADVTINTINIKTGAFSWTSNALFSYNRSKVTSLYLPPIVQTAQSILGGA
ncbi:MAG: SusC/RagA family TonB-linked outer membrane protein, partial [Mucilaginibacter sp.]